MSKRKVFTLAVLAAVTIALSTLAWAFNFADDVREPRMRTVMERINDEITSWAVEKNDGSVLAYGTLDPLFTITGGPVRCKIVGIVSTVLVGAGNGELVMTTTTPAATVDLNDESVSISADAAGTSYHNVGAASVFTPTTAGVVLIDPVTVEETSFILPIGTVSFSTSAAQTGNIKWYMTWCGLSPDSKVVAAD